MSQTWVNLETGRPHTPPMYLSHFMSILTNFDGLKVLEAIVAAKPFVGRKAFVGPCQAGQGGLKRAKLVASCATAWSQMVLGRGV